MNDTITAPTYCATVKAPEIYLIKFGPLKAISTNKTCLSLCVTVIRTQESRPVTYIVSFTESWSVWPDGKIFFNIWPFITM